MQTVKFKASEHVPMPGYKWAIAILSAFTIGCMVVDSMVGAIYVNLSIEWNTSLMASFRLSMLLFASVAIYLVNRYIVMFKTTYAHPFLVMCAVKSAFNTTDYAVYLNKFIYGVTQKGDRVDSGVVVSTPQNGVVLCDSVADLYLKEHCSKSRGKGVREDINQKLNGINYLMAVVGLPLAMTILSLCGMLIYAAVGENGSNYAIVVVIALFLMTWYLSLDLRTVQWLSVLFAFKNRYDHFIEEAFDGLAVAKMVQNAKDAESLAAVNSIVLKQYRYVVDLKYRFLSDILWIVALVFVGGILPYVAAAVAVAMG